MKKQRLYELIGRAVVYATGWILLEGIAVSAIVYAVCNCCTTIK